MTAVLLRRRKLGKGSTNAIAALAGGTISVVRNWRDRMPANVSHVIRWGCTSTVPQGVKVINSAESIHWCSDKRQGRLDMQAAGVSVPESWDLSAFKEIYRDFHGSGCDIFVLRPSKHAQGRALWTGYAQSMIDEAQRSGLDSGYVSRLIAKVAEYRVAVVQGRVAWVAQKTPGNPQDVAWNVAQGGRFDNVRWASWPLAVIEEALKAAKVSKTDFCGVDVMVDAEGKPYVLEVNSAPSLSSPYRQQCFAKCFQYMIDSGTESLPDPVSLSKWQHVIHPAVWGADD